MPKHETASTTLRRPPPGRWSKVATLVLLVAAVLGLARVAPAGLSAPGGLVDASLARFGFAIDEIRVVGHRHVLDHEVFEAISRDGQLALPLIDAAAARRRVEAIAWVESATITRVLPSRLDVTIIERKAVALWHAGDHHALVDRHGRVLARVAPTAVPELPRISGAGAPAAFAALAAAIALHPAVAKRLVRSERVGGRRWMLELADGTLVHLPEHGLEAALQRLADVEADLGVAAGVPQVVDLRHPGHVATRAVATKLGNARMVGAELTRPIR